MVSPLSGSIARTVYGAFKSLFLDATLTKDVAGTVVDRLAPPVTTTVSYTCKAIVETYSMRLRADGLVQANERKVLVLAKSLPDGIAPDATDRITVSGVTFTVAEVSTDPAGATWECRGRM